MSDDAFNMSMRKFLKQVGVTSQTEIEKAVRAAKDAGGISAETVTARMVLTIGEIELEHVVEAEIAVGDA